MTKLVRIGLWLVENALIILLPAAVLKKFADKTSQVNEKKVTETDLRPLQGDDTDAPGATPSDESLTGKIIRLGKNIGGRAIALVDTPDERAQAMLHVAIAAIVSLLTGSLYRRIEKWESRGDDETLFHALRRERRGDTTPPSPTTRGGDSDDTTLPLTPREKRQWNDVRFLAFLAIVLFIGVLWQKPEILDKVMPYVGWALLVGGIVVVLRYWIKKRGEGHNGGHHGGGHGARWMPTGDTVAWVVLWLILGLPIVGLLKDCQQDMTRSNQARIERYKALQAPLVETVIAPAEKGQFVPIESRGVKFDLEFFWRDAPLTFRVTYVTPTATLTAEDFTVNNRDELIAKLLYLNDPTVTAPSEKKYPGIIYAKKVWVNAEKAGHSIAVRAEHHFRPHREQFPRDWDLVAKKK